MLLVTWISVDAAGGDGDILISYQREEEILLKRQTSGNKFRINFCSAAEVAIKRDTTRMIVESMSSLITISM